MTMSVQSHKFYKMAKFIKMAKRLCLVDDLKMLKITMSNTSSRNKLNPEINDHYNILIGECQKTGCDTIQPVAPPSPDYIPGPEDPQTPPVPQDEEEREPMFIQPHDPDFVLEPIYLEYIPLEDEHVFPVEEQPLPPVVSTTAEYPMKGDDGEMMTAVHWGLTRMMRIGGRGDEEEHLSFGRL
ncbi:hypothetical protein Tco_1506343 [Tanacetum coccineum]